MSRRALIVLLLILSVALIALGLWLAFHGSASKPSPSAAPAPASAPPLPPTPTTQPAFAPLGVESEQLFLGNPSDARSDPAAHENYLMLKPDYALAYNGSTGTPRWVSWRLIAADLGSVSRAGDVFEPDSDLPAAFFNVVTRDYTGSGFDRGHQCPAGDRSSTPAAMAGTFIMTNVCPQAPNLNRKAWERLESYCRDLVKLQHDRLYIVCGPWGKGGVGSKGAADLLAGRVVVPAVCWKVIVVVPDLGRDDLSLIGWSTRVIAVNMPNDQEKVGEEWRGFRCSPAAIEAETGLHFFTRLAPALRQVLDNKVDTEAN